MCGNLPVEEADTDYRFYAADSADSLYAFFEHGNWPFRHGIVYGDMAFVNRVNGGDMWWTLKCFDGKWLSVANMTYEPVNQAGKLQDYISVLERATYQQCRTSTW